MSDPAPSNAALSSVLVELVAERLATLGEPTRIRLIEALRDGQATVQELADALDLDRRNTGHHLGLLASAGVLDRRRDGRSTFYSIADWGAVWLIDRTVESVDDRG